MKNFFLTNPLETFKSFSYNIDFAHLSTSGIDKFSDLGPFTYWDIVKMKAFFAYAFIFLLFWSAGHLLRVEKIFNNGYFYAIICTMLTNYILAYIYIQPIEEFRLLALEAYHNYGKEPEIITIDWLDFQAHAYNSNPTVDYKFEKLYEHYWETSPVGYFFYFQFLDELAKLSDENFGLASEIGEKWITGTLNIKEYPQFEEIFNNFKGKYATYLFSLDDILKVPTHPVTVEDIKPITFEVRKTSIQFEGVFTWHFEKEILSFLSFCFLGWALANSSGYSSSGYTDTLLFPQTILGYIDELIYRKNLVLFADTLQMKHEKEVRKFQEFFIIVQGILLFILIANVQGMVPYSSTITSSLVNTLYISLAVFTTIILTLIKEKGYQHFFSLFLPKGCPFPLIFLLNPIEFISYVFRLISLSVRLFANMMAGHTLMKVILGFSWSLLLLGDNYVIVHYIPFFVLFILTVLELAVGFIQTYIFVVLVYIYLSDVFTGH